MKVQCLLLLLTLVSTYAAFLQEASIPNQLLLKNSTINMGTWVASSTSVSGLSFSDIRKMLGDNSFGDMETIISKNKDRFSSQDIDTGLGLPISFDWRRKNPRCVGSIRDQSVCGSCWAFATTESTQDRTCIATNGKANFNYTPQDILECNLYDAGCDGGSFQIGGSAAATHGIRTNLCNPYDWEDLASCTQSCQSGSRDTFKTFCKNSTFFYNGVIDDNVAVILNDTNGNKVKRELMTHGPMYMTMQVYQDFMLYTSGIYEYVWGDHVYAHAIKLLGWGFDIPTGREYWVAANQWGTDWGEEGFFKIFFGECGFGLRAYACYIDTDRIKREFSFEAIQVIS